MTPEAAHAKALTELTEAFSRAHTDPAADAQAFLGRLARDGWRYVPAVADHPAPARTAPRPVAEAAIAEIRRDLADLKRRRQETGGAA